MIMILLSSNEDRFIAKFLIWSSKKILAKFFLYLTIVI
jgi:hypothetical protein